MLQPHIVWWMHARMSFNSSMKALVAVKCYRSSFANVRLCLEKNWGMDLIDFSYWFQQHCPYLLWQTKKEKILTSYLLTIIYLLHYIPWTRYSLIKCSYIIVDKLLCILIIRCFFNILPV
jgi:hypothetical protein